MGESESNALFLRKLKDLKERDPVRGRLLEGEIVEWASMVPAADDDSVWDMLYSQIQSIAERRKVSEEQVINDLFDQGSTNSFMMLIQLG
ncbi:MAG: hypothetical protein XU08_C0001G0244 [candidate division WWE3 bacterium CSP1-7]|uniref:Uncharacterized protein n=1 Tax=candidate division WWE3 bacterium CSP1-7 TaxID=1576480 RepID=A0A0T5ZYG1_UNCKA|nr:MAG: hypothetical protein XU08_C0001G0244 [candidate division WWE3 bacterium CSP1-7]